jgi:tRNA threonylcarbamoyladenosine biosynthesis protein TsaE
MPELASEAKKAPAAPTSCTSRLRCSVQALCGLEDDVTSPTFTLVHEYRGPAVNLFHVDLYRTNTARELETLGLDDLTAPNSIVMVEWGDKFPRFEHERDVEICLLRLGEDRRKIQLTTR